MTIKRVLFYEFTALPKELRDWIVDVYDYRFHNDTAIFETGSIYEDLYKSHFTPNKDWDDELDSKLFELYPDDFKEDYDGIIINIAY